MNWLESLLNLFRTKQSGVDRPSPSDIFTRADWMWTPGAAYWQTSETNPYLSVLRLGKIWTNIPFKADPILIPAATANTKSMDPVFDSPHHSIGIQGATPEDQKILVDWLANEWLNPPAGEQPRANILVYNMPNQGLVIHRLHAVTVDGQGVRHWQFMGDNNAGTPDPYLVEDSAIMWVVGAIAY